MNKKVHGTQLQSDLDSIEFADIPIDINSEHSTEVLQIGLSQRLKNELNRAALAQGLSAAGLLKQLLMEHLNGNK